MTDERFSMEVVGEVEIKLALTRMLRVAQHPELYLNKIGLIVKEQTRLRFVDGVSPSGEKWKAVLRGGKPLRDTGTHLMNAINHAVQGNEVFVGVPYAWASVHQFGATIHAKNAPYLRFKIGRGKNARWASKKSVTIPARPMFGINAEDQKQILEVIADAMIDKGQRSTKKA